jgi:hypothetical protein
MKAHARVWVLGMLVTAALAVALAGGAAQSAAGTTEACSDGRPFCVAITDLDGRSLSTAGSHYMKYSVSIRRNGGTSNLTNGTLTLTLEDIIGGTISNGTVVGGTPRASTAVFLASPTSTSACTIGSASNVLTCTVPNFPAGSAPLTYDPLIFKTSITGSAKGTRMTAVARFKEKASDGQPNDPNQDTVTVSETTTYEPDDDLDVSWAFPSAAITLATSATADDQHSSFPFSVPGATPSFTAFVQETPVGLAGANNPCTTTCYVEVVETNTACNGAALFSAPNPVHVTITWDFLPSGKTKNNIVVYHKLDAGSTEPISASCTFGTGGVPTNLPCRTVDIKRGGGQVTVTIDVFSASNGRWGVG